VSRATISRTSREADSGRRLPGLTLGHIADHRDPAHDHACLVAQRGVVPLEPPAAAGRGDGIRAVAAGDGPAGERLVEAAVLAGLRQEREELEGLAADHLLTWHPRQTLHGRIPHRVAEPVVESQDAVDTALDQGFEELVIQVFPQWGRRNEGWV
jgi:hypothetical protein